jgi:hypothetical protein
MYLFGRKKKTDLEFGDIVVSGNYPMNAAEMLRMATSKKKETTGRPGKEIELGLAVSLEAALLALRDERLKK